MAVRGGANNGVDAVDGLAEDCAVAEIARKGPDIAPHAHLLVKPVGHQPPWVECADGPRHDLLCEGAMNQVPGKGTIGQYQEAN